MAIFLAQESRSQNNPNQKVPDKVKYLQSYENELCVKLIFLYNKE